LESAANTAGKSGSDRTLARTDGIGDYPWACGGPQNPSTIRHMRSPKVFIRRGQLRPTGRAASRAVPTENMDVVW